MQLDWSNYAEENKICQITHPEKVLNYIENFAGLEEICHEAPSFLACYAPQLTIPEFSGPFSETFDLYLQDSEEKQLEYIGTNYGVSLTTNNAVPLCEVEIAFRHKTYGNYKPETLGNHYINGEMGCPSSKCYNPFEYIVWFLSQDSNWMPHNHKQIILEGIKTYPTWSLAYFNQIDADNVFMNKLHSKKSFKSFSLNKTVKESLEELITLSLKNLNLIDVPQVIIEKFLQCGFIEAHYEYKESRKRARKKVA